MKKKKKICIITGSRAEWGLFYPLAGEIRNEEKVFKLQIIATGAHLSRKYGMTYKEIEGDGFKVDKKVRIPLKNDTEEAMIKAVGVSMAGFSSALRSLKPDLVFLLGDRFETFSAAVACVFLKIPIAHIHGGEITEGSLDDTLRHAITKMSHLHFVSTDAYRKRVIQMGEEPARVFNVGALGLDNIRNTKLLKKKVLESKTGFKFGERNVLVTFNPATAESKKNSENQFKNLLKALDDLKGSNVLFTKPNPDMYSDTISRILDDYVSKNPDRCKAYKSLGRVLYLSALQYMDVVAGNSSSGIIEAPSFGIPTINIGNRQKGRVKALSVIDANGDLKSIEKALDKAFSRMFKRRCKEIKNIYGYGSASRKIINIIRNVDTTSAKKEFYNIKTRSPLLNKARGL